MAPSAQTGTGNITSASNTSATSLTTARPSNTVTGDLLWALVYFRDNSGTPSFTAPSGWLLGKSDFGNASIGFWVKPITNVGSEPANYTWSITGNSAGRCIMAIGRVTGADLNNPLDNAGPVSAYNGTTSLVLPSVDAQAANCLLLAIATCNNNTTTVPVFSLAPGMTGLTQLSVVVPSTNCSVIHLEQQALTSTGATGTRTPTMSPAAQNSAGYLVTIRGANDRAGTGTVTGSGTITASGKKAASGTGTASGTATVTVSGKKTGIGAGSLSASATLAGSGYTGATYWNIAVDWNNDGDFTGTGENVTRRALERTGLSMQYGRDQVRELSPMVAGAADLELANDSRDYSPDNVYSPLYGNVLTARPVRVTATEMGVTYTLFTGFTDDYTVNPGRSERSVSISGLDAVAKLKGAEATTPLYQGIRTGTAIGYVLDAIGWPAGLRDLDPGATTARWWWAQDEDAFDAIQKLVQSEGPPAMLTSDEQGRIVFRDRHHRLLNSASTTPQQTFSDQSVAEPSFTDMAYDHGWQNIVNSVSVKVDELDPADEPTAIWQSESQVSVGANATLTLHLTLDSPAVRPQVSYTVLSGTVTDNLTVDSGQTLTLALTAGSGGALLSDLQVLGQPVTAQRSYTILLEDQASITQNGFRSLTYDVPWAGFNDATAVAQLILDASAQRRPIITLTLRSETGAPSTRLLEQFNRDLSDRVHVREPETCVDHDFHIEQITHKVLEAGKVLETTFGMERAIQQADDVFRFNDSAHGFDQGVFASVGLTDPALLFVFDQAGHGFNQGVFGT